MSWSFQLQKINQSFEHIASWYHEFMRRTEVYLRGLNERILLLENQSAHAPTDEQVERVLRKILADKFSEGIAHHVQSPDTLKEEECFIDARKQQADLKPIHVDTALLLVDPDAVPSKAYADTMKLLDRRLVDFPKLDRYGAVSANTGDGKLDHDSRQPRSNGF